MRGFRAVMIAIAALASHACTDSSSTPVTPSNSAPILIGSPLDAPSKVVVFGTPPAIGASSQFTATAVQADGSSATITSLAGWRSSNPAVATVSSSGMVSGVQAGAVEISAIYAGVTGSLSFTVAAARTFTLSGTVTDATSGAGLASASLIVQDAAGLSRAALPDAAGRYAISGIRSGTVSVAASAPGYITSTKSVTVLGDMTVNFPLSRQAACPTLGFDDQQPNAAPFAAYRACGFTVTPTTPNWTISTTYGHPAPFIQFLSPAGSTTSGEISVSAGGTKFRFQSVDLYSSTTPIPYVMTGISNSAVVFRLENTQGNTFGNFATIVNPQSSMLIDTLLIRLSNPSAPCCQNPMGLDTIVVSF